MNKQPPTRANSIQNAYADVNGIRLYYEIHGSGNPLVLLHGGGSTIDSTFGRILSPLSQHHQVIAVELQNHGRSGFRNSPQTFEQDADDVITLLSRLGIKKASLFGFSNGGTTALQIAIRNPEVVDKLVVAAAAFTRAGFIPGFFEGMLQATLENMPEALKKDFLKVNPDPVKLQTMFERDRDRMIAFRDINSSQIQSIAAPTLIINGDADVITLEHAVELHRLIPDARLAILPGSHGAYLGEATTLCEHPSVHYPIVELVLEFLRPVN